MNCTLISGPESSNKIALIRWILAPYTENAICCLKPLENGPNKEDTIGAIEEFLSPECRLIVVDEIQTLYLLKSWLLLSRRFGLLSTMVGQPSQVVRPDIVLIFESEKPITELLTSDETSGIKIIDFTSLPVIV